VTDSTASRYRYLPTLLIILGLSWLASPAALADETGSTADQQRLEWNFKVYLDDSPIGFHRFSLSGDQQQRQLVTEADFQVKFLFITAYRYQHQNTETWQGDCLERLESRTDANGKLLSVVGERGPESFQVIATGTQASVQSCVKSFAYWDPRFLEESRLLNSQTGELIPVVIESLPGLSYKVRGKEVPAQGYRMRGKNLDMEIWYSPDRQWLGLVSNIKGDRTLRYELI